MGRRGKALVIFGVVLTVEPPVPFPAAAAPTPEPEEPEPPVSPPLNPTIANFLGGEGDGVIPITLGLDPDAAAGTGGLVGDRAIGTGERGGDRAIGVNVRVLLVGCSAGMGMGDVFVSRGTGVVGRSFSDGPFSSFLSGSTLLRTSATFPNTSMKSSGNFPFPR